MVFMDLVVTVGTDDEEMSKVRAGEQVLQEAQ